MNSIADLTIQRNYFISSNTKPNNQLIKNNLSKQLIKQLEELPIKFDEKWQYCVASHIKRMGWNKVLNIANRSTKANKPENYFMAALSKESFNY